MMPKNVGTFNGIGLRLLGHFKENKKTFATIWFTLFYIPLFPIERIEYKSIGKGRFQPIQKTPIVFSEVIKTYLFGWFIFPLLLSWPFLIILFSELMFISISQNFYPSLLLLGLLFFIGGGIYLYTWDEKRL